MFRKKEGAEPSPDEQPGSEQKQQFEDEISLFADSPTLEAELEALPSLIQKQQKTHEMIKRLDLVDLNPIIWRTLMGGPMSRLDEDEQEEFKEKLYRALLKRLEQQGKL